MLFKLLGRLTWHLLKVIAPPLARRFQQRLTGERPARRLRPRRFR